MRIIRPRLALCHATCMTLSFFMCVSPVGAEPGKSWLQQGWDGVSGAGARAAQAVASGGRAVYRGLTAPALAPRQGGEIYARFGVTHIQQNVDSGPLIFEESTSVAGITVVNEGPMPGSEVDVSDEQLASIQLGYMFTPHIGIETILGLPAIKFDYEPAGSLRTDSLDALGLVGPFQQKLGTAKALPIITTLTYQPFPANRVRPYLGVGAAYVYTYDEELTNRQLWTDENNPDTAPDFEVSDEWGAVGQLGLEVDITPKWFFNADVKYIDLEVRGNVRNAVIDSGIPLIGEVEASDSYVDVELDPLVYTIAVGRVF